MTPQKGDLGYVRIKDLENDVCEVCKCDIDLYERPDRMCEQCLEFEYLTMQDEYAEYERYREIQIEIMREDARHER